MDKSKAQVKKKHPQTGRYHARNLYPETGTCELCGAADNVERHHRDGDTFNNSRENIAFLCHSCHRAEHTTRGIPLSGLSPEEREPGLTPPERELLRLIKENRRMVNPTARQLQVMMGFKSPGSISALFRKLRGKGYLAD